MKPHSLRFFVGKNVINKNQYIANEIASATSTGKVMIRKVKPEQGQIMKHLFMHFIL